MHIMSATCGQGRFKKVVIGQRYRRSVNGFSGLSRYVDTTTPEPQIGPPFQPERS